MEKHNGTLAFYAASRKEWRKWLEKHHQKSSSVWLIIYHKKSDRPSIYYDEAVEEAICFGWIDSIAHKRDDESKYQFFAKRNAKSNWSRANKQRADAMIKNGLMTPAGMSMIELAKDAGKWDALVDIQNSVIPPDLQQLFYNNKVAYSNFIEFAPSSKRIILEWILNAKKPETRQKRLAETVALAEKNIKANHYRQ